MVRASLALAIVIALSLGGTARAQVSGPQAQLQGRIDRLTLSPEGLPDGFVLDSGIEVHFHRHLGPQLATTLKRGELVKAQGTYLAMAHLLLASTVTDLVTHQEVVDSEETDVTSPPVRVGTPSSTEGEVRLVLHGIEGQVDGAVLDNGKTVRLPENVPALVASLLTVGQNLAVEGQEIDTENGPVIRIESMGPSANELTPVRPPSTPQL